MASDGATQDGSPLPVPAAPSLPPINTILETFQQAFILGASEPEKKAPVAPKAATCVYFDFENGSTPPSRSGHTIVALNDNTLLLFGGGPDENVSNDVYRITLVHSAPPLGCAKCELIELDPRSRGHRPNERDRHSAWVWDNKMYIFGGEDIHGFMYSDMWAFNPQSASWKDIRTTGATPCARRGQTCTLVDDTMWMFGGLTLDENSVNDVHVFDMRTSEFKLVTCKGTPPCGRRGHSATLKGRSLYFFGGCDQHEGLLGDLWELNIDTLTWRLVQSYTPETPGPRVGHAAAIFQGDLIVFGGNILSERESCNETWLWDFEKEKWFRLQLLNEPRARSYHAIIANKGTVLALGGWSGEMSMNDLMVITVADFSLKRLVAEYIIRNQVPYKEMTQPHRDPVPKAIPLAANRP